ncbi:amidohydrolase [Winogradskyella sp. DF17]|uniref:Amidohydrolase n=1 Tax=Winogradskyella pelagia TaxID=2819984 RepID=A0ABS3T563_9FLAO|nr:amidohydrolase [Winogradskyella sp. DF17]MBO3117885.1 amidohydrolase [Winogradskyella sp. DF17]
MNDSLKIALVQTHLIWESPEQNLKQLEEKITPINDGVDVIVLPEMLTSGFTMNAEVVAESMDGPSVQWLKFMAKKKNTAITGSLVIKEGGQYYNRLIFSEPSGKISTYDKKHTFTLAGEDKVYTAGKEKVIIKYKDWSICPLICYDLRFPVWARNVEDYDLLLYVANWPKPRISAWDALLKARAIENMSYCVGVNRIGLDGTNHEYPGHSGVYDALGNRLDDLKPNTEGIAVITLQKNHLNKYRNKLGFLKDRDGFNLKD